MRWMADEVSPIPERTVFTYGLVTPFTFMEGGLTPFLTRK
jgi:hypothetical protein